MVYGKHLFCQYRLQKNLYKQTKNCVLIAVCKNHLRGIYCEASCCQLNNLTSEMEETLPLTQLSIKEGKEKLQQSSGPET